MVKAWRESKLGGEDEAHGRFYRSKPPLPKVFRRANKTGPPPLPPLLGGGRAGVVGLTMTYFTTIFFPLTI